jgi:transcriptional regulator with XRE-family HTH domain
MFKPDLSELPPNPIKNLREKNKLNIAQLSRASNVSTQQIRDVEHGLLQSVPTGIIRHFSHEVSGEILDRQYNDWRRNKRNLVKLPPVESLSISSDVHPLTQYREKTLGWATAAFCDFLCIPRFVLMHYERGQKRMPRVLRNEAFPQANLSPIDVARLANLGEMFYVTQEQRKIRERQAYNN